MKVLFKLAAVLFICWLADTGAAIHAERTIAAHTRDAASAELSPAVFLGGKPYLQALITANIPIIFINAQDIDVPTWGLINAATTLRDVSISPLQALSGDLRGATAATFTSSISLDSVAIGRLLGMDDLAISHPEDISPTGGQSAEAQLTGTIPGEAKPSTATVELRLVGSTFIMRPLTGPAAFTLTLDTHELPLPAPASKVSMQGGSLTFEAQRRAVTLTDPLLAVAPQH